MLFWVHTDNITGKTMNRLVITILFLATAWRTYGSQEGVLAFSRFRIESDGIGSSGKIVVEGSQNEKTQIVALKVSAFGKDYVVPHEKFVRLAELHSNGIRISYE